MSDKAIKLEPVGLSARIDALDILRGVAVLGILLVNIPAMGLPFDWPKPYPPVVVTADWIAYVVDYIAVSGAMRGLFTLLFGASMMIMLTRPDPPRQTAALEAYYTRCMALMLLGVVNYAVFLWPGEILFNYGLCGLALPLFRKAPVRLLAVSAVVLLVVMTIGTATPALKDTATLRVAETAEIVQKAGGTLTADQKAALAGRDAKLNALVSPEARAKERDRRTQFPAVLAWSHEVWYALNFSPSTAAYFWYAETLGFMLLGIAVFKTGVLTGARSNGFYARILAGSLLAGLLVRGGVAYLRWRADFAPDSLGLPLEALTYQFSRLAMTLAWMSGLLLLIKAGALGVLAHLLSAVGRTALSNYILQAAVTSILFYALGLFDRLGFAQLIGLAGLIWAGQALVSVLWLQRFDMGPAEWMLRNLTYGAWRPLGRSSASRQT